MDKCGYCGKCFGVIKAFFSKCSFIRFFIKTRFLQPPPLCERDGSGTLLWFRFFIETIKSGNVQPDRILKKAKRKKPLPFLKWGFAQIKII